MSSLEQFVFFKSYYKAMRNAPPKVVGEVLLDLCRYYFEDVEIPERKGAAGMILEMARPVISKSKAKAESGRKGGEANRKQTESKLKANPKQIESKPEAIKDKEKDKDNIKENIKRKSEFSPPTLDEVTDYCRERNSSVDPKQFFDYFNEGGWVDAKGQKVRNWKQKLLTWEKFNTGGAKVVKPGNKFHNFEERSYDFGDLERRFARN